MRLRSPIAATLLACALGACSSPVPPAPQVPTAPPAGAPGTARAPLPAPTTPALTPDVLAAEPQAVGQVGDRVITVDDVRAVLDARGGVPNAAGVKTVVDEMVEAALLADTARGEGFADNPEVRHALDQALAEMFLQSKLRAEAAATVTPEDVAAYFVPRRRAAKLVVADEARARSLYQRLTAAIADAPARATTLFAEFRAAHGSAGARDPQRGIRTPFDARGRSNVGAAIEHAAVAEAAFALDAVGQVSEPVALGDGKWSLVQALAILDGVAPDAITEAQERGARQVLTDARQGAAKRDFMARLQRDAAVRVDSDQILALSRAMSERQRRKPPFDIRRWRKDTLRGARTRPAGLGPSRTDLTATAEERLRLSRPEPDTTDPGSTP